MDRNAYICGGIGGGSATTARSPTFVILVARDNCKRDGMIDLFGCAASALVLGPFLRRRSLALQRIAILSNFLFFAYGWAANAAEIRLLHSIIFPINVVRLAALTDLKEAAAKTRRLAAETRHPATDSELGLFGAKVVGTANCQTSDPY